MHRPSDKPRSREQGIRIQSNMEIKDGEAVYTLIVTAPADAAHCVRFFQDEFEKHMDKLQHDIDETAKASNG